MSLRILTEVRSPTRGSKRRTLVLDHEPHCSVPVEVLKELSLRPGDELDADELDARIRSLAPRFARERSLRLLSVRERTASELTRRLLDDGYEPDLVTDTVDHLVETGLVDDLRYAELMARVLVATRRLGRSRAFRELVMRGVPEEMAAEALDVYAPREAELQRATETAARLVRSNDSVPRLAARLVRRGFAPGDAFAAARSTVLSEYSDETMDSC